MMRERVAAANREHVVAQEDAFLAALRALAAAGVHEPTTRVVHAAYLGVAVEDGSRHVSVRRMSQVLGALAGRGVVRRSVRFRGRAGSTTVYALVQGGGVVRGATEA